MHYLVKPTSSAYVSMCRPDCGCNKFSVFGERVSKNNKDKWLKI